MPEQRMHVLKRANGKVLGFAAVCLFLVVSIFTADQHMGPTMLFFAKGFIILFAAATVWGIAVMIRFGVPTDPEWYLERRTNWKLRQG